MTAEPRARYTLRVKVAHPVDVTVLFRIVSVLHKQRIELSELTIRPTERGASALNAVFVGGERLGAQFVPSAVRRCIHVIDAWIEEI